MPAIMPDLQAVRKELQKAPNVGPRVAQDLIDLGFTAIRELKGQDPLEIYHRLEANSGSRQDPCVLDTFIALVDHAETGVKRPWYDFTAFRKEKYKGQC